MELNLDKVLNGGGAVGGAYEFELDTKNKTLNIAIDLTKFSSCKPNEKNNLVLFGSERWGSMRCMVNTIIKV